MGKPYQLKDVDQTRLDEKKWDLRFLDLANHISQWSKDPSTKVGAVIVDANRRVIAMGYNGFPRYVNDAPERYADREVKLSHVVHAELNAILNSVGSVEGCTLYVTPLAPCDRCAVAIIQSGIERVVFETKKNSKWAESWEISRGMFEEADIQIQEHSCR